jgi:hypothetical protein
MEKSDAEEPAIMDPEKGEATPDSTNSIVAEETGAETPQAETLTGWKLYLTLFSVMIVGFLITLDASIVVTVCDPRFSYMILVD